MNKYTKLDEAGYEIIDGFGTNEEAKTLAKKVRALSHRAKVVRTPGNEYSVYADADYAKVYKSKLV